MSLGRKAAENLDGKIAVITGASAGIGKAVALEYLEASNGKMKLALGARRVEKLEELKKDLLSRFPDARIHIARLDVTDFQNIQQFFATLPKDFKDIDILVNNAGKALGTDKVGSIEQDDIHGMIDTNVTGLINVTQMALPIFKKKNSGDIVNLGSIAGREPYPTGSIYCATKHAVRAFGDSLRKELINTNIRVIEVAPGMVETEFSITRYKGDKSDADNVYKGITPLYAEDIADLIIYATSRKQNVVIADTLIFPTHQASASHIYRET